MAEKEIIAIIKSENLIVKIQQAANYFGVCCFLEYLFFFLTRRQIKQKVGGKNWRSYYRCTWYTYHIKDALDNHEQAGGGACCRRPRQRGTDASFTRVLLRSCRDVRRPRHLPNANNCRNFSMSSRWDHEKSLYFGDPQTGESIPPRVSNIQRAFQKTQNEKQSVVTVCAPRCIAGREAAAAQ